MAGRGSIDYWSEPISFLWFFIADNQYKLRGYECMILSPTSLEKETEGGYKKKI